MAELPVRPVAEDTATLVARAQGGSRSACSSLLKQVSPRIQRTVYFMGGGAEVDDLMQQTYVQILQSLRSFRGDAAFTTWVDRITVRTVLKHRRSMATKPSTAPLEDERFEGPGRGAGEARVALSRAIAVLEKISSRRRTALVLHVVQGHTTAEIAEIMGCTRVTAKALVLRGRKDLVKLGQRDPHLRDLITGRREGSR